MKPELKARWVKALLSGKYAQGVRWLHNADDNTYCCIGVLREVGLVGPHENDWALLPTHQREMLDLDDQVELQLSFLNDAGVPFDMIAGLIETAL